MMAYFHQKPPPGRWWFKEHRSVCCVRNMPVNRISLFKIFGKISKIWFHQPSMKCQGTWCHLRTVRRIIYALRLRLLQLVSGSSLSPPNLGPWHGNAARNDKKHQKTNALKLYHLLAPWLHVCFCSTFTGPQNADGGNHLQKASTLGRYHVLRHTNDQTTQCLEPKWSSYTIRYYPLIFSYLDLDFIVTTRHVHALSPLGNGVPNLGKLTKIQIYL